MLMSLFLQLVYTVKASGDVNISEDTIGAVAGPGAHFGVPNLVTSLRPSSKDEGVYNHTFTCMYCFG